MLTDNQFEIIKKIEYMSLVKENWDGFGGLPVKPDVIEAAKNIIKNVPESPEFTVEPLSRGGIQLEFGTNSRMIEISIEDASSIEYFKYDIAKDVNSEGQCDIDDYEQVRFLIIWVNGYDE